MIGTVVLTAVLNGFICCLYSSYIQLIFMTYLQAFFPHITNTL